MVLSLFLAHSSCLYSWLLSGVDWTTVWVKAHLHCPGQTPRRKLLGGVWDSQPSEHNLSPRTCDPPEIKESPPSRLVFSGHQQSGGKVAWSQGSHPQASRRGP